MFFSLSTTSLEPIDIKNRKYVLISMQFKCNWSLHTDINAANLRGVSFAMSVLSFPSAPLLKRAMRSVLRMLSLSLVMSLFYGMDYRDNEATAINLVVFIFSEVRTLLDETTTQERRFLLERGKSNPGTRD